LSYLGIVKKPHTMTQPEPGHTTLVLTLLCALSAAAFAGCGGDATCASAGTYAPTVTRTADHPGDCPLDQEIIEQIYELKTVSVDANEACGPASDNFEGSMTSSQRICSYSGSLHLRGSASGIDGTATITSDCWGDYAVSCTANYDVTYTRQGS
jgi:hypothetical protein